jgi:uncharacterized membrane protein
VNYYHCFIVIVIMFIVLLLLLLLLLLLSLLLLSLTNNMNTAGNETEQVSVLLQNLRKFSLVFSVMD